MSIHIWLNSKKTKDAQQHAPAGTSKGGQFVSSGGATSAKGAAEYHGKKQAEHGALSQAKTKSEAQQVDHEEASYHHGEATEHFTTAAVTPKSDPRHAKSMAKGEYHASEAAKYENGSKLSGRMFSTSSGNSDYHLAEAKKHQNHPDTPASTNQTKKDSPAYHRVMAAYYHNSAEHHLNQAGRTANYREQNLSNAQKQADLAKHHEGMLGGGTKK